MAAYRVIYWNQDGSMVEDEFEATTAIVSDDGHKVRFETAFGKREYSSDRHDRLDWFKV